MRIRIALFGALLCLSASTIVSRADDRSDIQSLFYKISRAMSAKDPGGVMAAGTSDLTFVDRGKVLSGNQIARHMQQRFRLMQGSPQCRIQVLSLSIKGKSASVLTSDYTSAEVPGSTGRVHKVIAMGKSRDEVVKTKRGWLLKSVYVLTDNMTMDGRPIGGGM